jgi:O-antigen ligase
MNLRTKDSTNKKIGILALIITLVLSPNINKDSLIIPKVSLLFILALYLLPKLIFNLKGNLSTRQIKILSTILFLILLQLIIVFVSSDAPFEQQLYGRTGRGLGFLTHFSLLIVLLSTAVFIRKTDLALMIKLITISGIITSVYSIFQSYGLDFLRWESRTNGVIGTLGNPNFQSAFAAMVLVPSIFAFWQFRYKFLISILFVLIFIFTIYRTQSTQGYVSAVLGFCVFSFLFTWYKNRLFALLISVIYFGAGLIAIFGMINYGPLTSYLYKVSVQSRGDFWRSAFTTANENPLTGVGIDSFGDSYLKYRDAVAVSHPWAEYADNAHNFFLEYAATGGYILMILQIVLVIFVFQNFLKAQKKLASFNLELTVLFTAWVVFQAQSVISPGNISMMLWNSIISGIIVGYSALIEKGLDNLHHPRTTMEFVRPFSILCVMFAIIINYPLFNTDRLQMQAMSRRDGDLAILSTQKYPKSVLRYSIIARELLSSQLFDQALVVARSAVEFNPNSANLWSLILINPKASPEERLKAKREILKLDPLNQEVISYKLP